VDRNETRQRIRIVRKLANVRRWLDSHLFVKSLVRTGLEVTPTEIRAAIIDDQCRLPYLTVHFRQSLIFIIQPKLSANKSITYWLLMNMGAVNIRVGDNGTVSQAVLEFVISSVGILNLLATEGTVSIYSDLIDPAIRLIYNTRLEPWHLSSQNQFLNLVRRLNADIEGPLQQAQSIAAVAFNNSRHLDEEWLDEDFGDANDE